MKSKTLQKKIKAWAFLADDRKKGKYFITEPNNSAEIYLKKPTAMSNPFDYGNQGIEWKPTKIEIIIT